MDPIEFTICQFHMKVIDTKLHVYLREKIMMTWQLKQLLAVMKIILAPYALFALEQHLVTSNIRDSLFYKHKRFFILYLVTINIRDSLCSLCFMFIIVTFDLSCYYLTSPNLC